MKRITIIIVAVILLMIMVLAGRSEIYAAIIGNTDDRQVVEDSETEPYCVTVYVYSQYSSGLYEIGSGILVGPNIVLTCCHCIMDNDEIADSITVIPGKNGEDKPYGRAGVTQLVRHSDLKVDKEINQDWDSTIGNSGGPVFAKSGNGEIMLLGLASGTTGENGADFPDSKSLCTLIGDDVYGIVQELLNEGNLEEQDDEEENGDFGSYYYAEGYGLSAYLYTNTGSNPVCEIMNYNSTQDPYVGSAFHMYFMEWVDDADLQSTDGSLWITLQDDGSLKISFADITEFYRQEDTVVFYPADVSAKGAEASDWEGTFREINDVISDYEYYYTIRNLFGSNDYVLECRVTEYGNVRDQIMLVLLESRDGMLVHMYEPGDIYPVPTYGCYLVDENYMYSSEGSVFEEDFPGVLQQLRNGQGVAYERTSDFWE